MTEPTEKHYFNHLNRVDRAINEMLGVVRGILCDGKVSDEEARGLKEWIHNHDDIFHIWPVFTIYERLQRIFTDGVVDEDERADLNDMLQKLIGGGLARATQLPVDEPPPALIFQDKRYVFTGKFAYGIRRRCEEAVTERGAICPGSISILTDYLVIGEIGSADWKYSAWGTKIHEAMKLREENKNIVIVSEQHWISSFK